MLINTNISAQNASLLLTQSSQRLQQSLARLSSGSKINSPADDAAGLAVSMNFNAQIGRADAAGNNVGNALSFSQTQDGYLQQVSNALNRMSELAVQAQDVTKSDSDRSLYNQEFQTLATYINNVGTKDFNGVSLFSSNDLNVTSDSEGGAFQMKGISSDFGVSGTSMPGSSDWSANSTMGQLFSGFYAGNVQVEGPGNNAEGWSIVFVDTFSGTVNKLNTLMTDTGNGGVTYDARTGQLSVTVAAGQKLYDEGHTYGEDNLLTTLKLHDLDNTNGSSPVTMTSTFGTITPGTTTGAPDISTTDDARAALTTIKTAISTLAGDRAKVGANMERLNSTSQELSTLKNNLSAANSRITDVDVAAESTNYAKYNILVQTGTAMLAQANSAPQSILKLLG